MDNVFIYQSAELPDFARSPKGTIGVFFCEWNKLQQAQNRITGKFKHSSLKNKGKCTIKSFSATDPDTGNGFKVLMAEVITPIEARKKRGRPLGAKNALPANLTPLPSNTEVEADAVGKSRDISDKHLDDVTKGKVKFWPMY